MAAERNWIDLENHPELEDLIEEARLHGGAVFIHRGGRPIGRVSTLKPYIPKAEDAEAIPPAADHARRPAPRRWDVERDDDEEFEEVRREVARTGEPIQLFFDGQPGAIIVPHPFSSATTPKGKTEEDRAAFRRAIGSWADIDADAVADAIARRRIEGSRPTEEQ
jgi:antitoxin (DNA-binding transcriptional repressor) of toxin-antitoxin stability system